VGASRELPAFPALDLSDNLPAREVEDQSLVFPGLAKMLVRREPELPNCR
jgi:hypothetical protein